MPASSDRYYLPVSLNGRGYQIDVAKYKRSTLPVKRDGQDPSREPSEQSLSLQGQWRRNASDWALGAGQAVWDEQLLFGGPVDRNSQRSRYRTSKGIDVWTKGQISLLKDTAVVRAWVTGGSGGQVLIAANTYIYAIDGNQLRYTANPTAAVPTWSAIALPAATGSFLTTDGTSVFVAFNDGVTPIQVTVIGSATVAAFGVQTPPLLAYANGRLIWMTGTVLKEMDGAGAVGGAGQLVYSRSHGQNWVGARSAPNGIYVFTPDEVYVITENDQTGGLNVPILAMTLPIGETLQDMLYYGGLFVLGTSRGVRLAAVSTNGALVYGPLLPINDMTGGVKHLAASGEFVWFDWNNYDATSIGLGRLDLAHFTEPMVPAYASDVMVTVPNPDSNTTLNIVIFNGTPQFTISVSGTNSLYRPTSSYVASGTMSSGHIRFGTFEPKTLHSLDVRHEALNGSVDLHVVLDDGTDYPLGSSNTAGSLKPASLLIVNPGNQPKCEDAEVKLVLNRSTTPTLGPVVLRWTFKATVQPYRQEQFLVPLVFKHRVLNSEGEGSQIAFDDLRAEYVLLKTLETAGTVFNYTEGDTTHSVSIESIELGPERWDDHFQFFEGLINVTLISQGPTS